MLLPKGGVNWKAAKARLPPSRAVWHFLTRTRFLLFVAIAGIIVLLWRGLSDTAGEMQRYVGSYIQAPQEPVSSDLSVHYQIRLLGPGQVTHGHVDQ